MITTNQLTIGQGVEIINYSTKQEGHGKLSLYVDVITDAGELFNNIYVQDVSPNIEEYYNRSYANRDSVYINEDGKYQCPDTDRIYEEDEIYNSINELLNKALNGNKIAI